MNHVSKIKINGWYKLVQEKKMVTASMGYEKAGTYMETVLDLLPVCVNSANE